MPSRWSFSWDALSCGRNSCREPLQESADTGEVGAKEVLMIGDELAQFCRRGLFLEAAQECGEDRLGGNGAMVDPGQVRASTPDCLAKAPRVRRQESEQMLPAIGHHVEPVSRPAPQRRPS